MNKIKVIGVGGSGSNAVSRMFKSNIRGVELAALNTDEQDLKKTKAHEKLRIGRKVTQGLGAGMNPEIGKKAALENKEEITELLKGSDMVFIAYGAGGGTGSGAGPVVAEIAKSLGILTVAVVTKPFSFEGATRQKIAEAGIRKLKDKVDTLLVVKNDKLLEILDSKTDVLSAFWVCDEVLQQAVSGITDLIFLPGIINVDFADVRAIMSDAGSALFGVGLASGEKRAELAAKSALKSPLLDVSPKGAKGVLFNVSGGRDISLSEIDEVAKVIIREINPQYFKELTEGANKDAEKLPASQTKVIFGAVQDEKLKKGEIKVTVIATGF